MKTKSKISGYMIRSGAWTVFLSVVFIALSSAFDSPNAWHKPAITTAIYDITSKTPSQPRAFSCAERVAFQRAIEEVYWRHRIWPKENSEPKPSLDVVMPQARLEKKVADYLRDSLVLEDYWQKPITAEQLQAEMDRMARDTNQPEVLRELFEALGNDPAVVAECLARPTLAERLIADLSAQNQTRHVESPRTCEVRTISVATMFGQVFYTLPTIADVDGPPCIDDTWIATSTTNAPDARYRHTAVWTGSEMIIWGGLGNTGGRYSPSTDLWRAISTMNAPSPRQWHTAIWSGSKMIIWGGLDYPVATNTGANYDPGTDAWEPTNTANAPQARAAHTAVWTGSEMIVWGGWVITPFGYGFYNTGGRYNPNTDSWTASSTTNAPSERGSHTAVWTGSEMIVWGGFGANLFNTGGRYNPSTNSWIATSTTNAPDARDEDTAIWTGSEMIIWGGTDQNNHPRFNTGGRYNPSADNWTATSITNAPSARMWHTAVWSGSEMIIWGGSGVNAFLNTGGRYNPNTDTWTATSMANAPIARALHTAVWSGGEMIVWGGWDYSDLNTGARYCARCSVTSTVCGRIIEGTAPTDFTVNLSDPADPATVKAGDFTVNGAPADNYIIINGDLTISFHFNISPAAGGQNTMHIPAGAFNCGQGPVQEFMCTFFYRVPGATPPPRPRPTPHPRLIPR
jgi:hypothetical protein